VIALWNENPRTATTKRIVGKAQQVIFTSPAKAAEMCLIKNGKRLKCAWSMPHQAKTLLHNFAPKARLSQNHPCPSRKSSQEVEKMGNPNGKYGQRLLCLDQDSKH